MRNLAFRSMAAVLLLALFASCDSDAGDNERPSEISIAELLRWAPEPSEQRWHFDIISLARLRELTGVSLPDDLGDPNE